MTRRQRSGDLVAVRAQDDVASVHGVVARADDRPLSRDADLSNVIPFARGRRHGAEIHAPPVTLAPEDRPAPPPPSAGFYRQIVLAVASLAIHGGLVFAFWEQPRPLAGSGAMAMMVDIVIGDNKPVGGAPTPNEGQQADERPVGQERAAEISEEQPNEPRSKTRVMTAEALRETPVELPVEEPKPPEQEKAARSKASEEEEMPRGAGPAFVASEASYDNEMSLHMARNQKYPASALRKGIRGKGVVSFSIDGTGAVTSVNVAVGTGAPVLDREMVAMVRRASPFPAPPDGRSRRFSVPVNFAPR